MGKISDIDWGLVKANLISNLPTNKTKMKMDGTTEQVVYPQQMIDQSFSTLMEDLSFDIPMKYVNEPRQFKIDKKQQDNIFTVAVSTDRHQNKNILLSPELWHMVMETPKQKIGNDRFRMKIDRNNLRVNFARLSAKTLDNDEKITLPVMTTIQFDFNHNAQGRFEFVKYMCEAQNKFKNLLSSKKSFNYIDELVEISKKTQNFSIHEYYLPDGITTNALSNATLLMRYDRCEAKHKNGSIPKLYKAVFPDYVEEPHFHFNCGFGGIYKLTNEKETNMVGVGYAIGASGLHDYLQKLQTGEYKDKEEQELYLNNDFGMPFLQISKLDSCSGGGRRLKDIADTVGALATKDLPIEQELLLAYDACNMITSIERPRELTFEKETIVDNQTDDELTL